MQGHVCVYILQSTLETSARGYMEGYRKSHISNIQPSCQVRHICQFYQSAHIIRVGSDSRLLQICRDTFLGGEYSVSFFAYSGEVN